MGPRDEWERYYFLKVNSKPLLDPQDSTYNKYFYIWMSDWMILTSKRYRWGEIYELENADWVKMGDLLDWLKESS